MPRIGVPVDLCERAIKYGTILMPSVAHCTTLIITLAALGR